MFLRSSATELHDQSTCTTNVFECVLKLKSRSPLTLYVLSNERVVHYVTVICFQDFLKFGDVIVLVGAGRKNSQCFYMMYNVSVTHTELSSG